MRPKVWTLDLCRGGKSRCRPLLWRTGGLGVNQCAYSVLYAGPDRRVAVERICGLCRSGFGCELQHELDCNLGCGGDNIFWGAWQLIWRIHRGSVIHHSAKSGCCFGFIRTLAVCHAGVGAGSSDSTTGVPAIYPQPLIEFFITED